MKALLRLIMIGFTATLLAGCSSSGGGTQHAGGVDAATSSGTSGYVVMHDTPYYTNSPAQPMPPNGTLVAGSAVTKVKAMGNYTYVRLVDGSKAYVATKDIAPAAR